MDIATAKAQLLIKHYNMLKERDSWYNPDKSALEEINRDIAEVAKFIEMVDEIQDFLYFGR